MNYYNDIKNELINNEINKRVKNYSINRGDLNTYYKVGKILSEDILEDSIIYFQNVRHCRTNYHFLIIVN